MIPLDNTSVTAGGIIIPDTVSKEKPEKGEVVAVGPGKLLDNGSRAKVDVEVGKIVLFSKYSPTEVEIKGTKYLILDMDDVKAIVEESK